jgi:DNA polymerase-3 subunit epsilon
LPHSSGRVRVDCASASTGEGDNIARRLWNDEMLRARSRSFAKLSEAVVVNVETTGLSAHRDRIVSFAAVKIDYDRSFVSLHEIEYIYEIVNPGRKIPISASRVHGITNTAVDSLAPFSQYAEALRDFIGDLPVVAHNVSFDASFLNSEFKRANVFLLAKTKTYCAMTRTCFHGRASGLTFSRIGLEKAAEFFSISAPARGIHDALDDARICAQISWKVRTADRMRTLIQ